MAPLPPPSPPPIPPPVPVETHPNRAGGLKPPVQPRLLPDPTRLAPEDAYYAPSVPRTRPPPINYDGNVRPFSATRAAVAALRPPPAVPGAELSQKEARKHTRPSSRRRRKGAWKKLLWVKQSYPDNYTDTETFLDHLQRNPRVRPYDFWPLVADSTIIVQHVSSVAIFVCCFVGIVQERLSPVSVVGWGSVGTAMGWILWDSWVWKKEAEEASNTVQAQPVEGAFEGDDGSSSGSTTSSVNNQVNGEPRIISQKDSQKESRSQSQSRIHGLGLSISTNVSDPQFRRRSTGFSADSAIGGPDLASPWTATTPTANGALSPTGQFAFETTESQFLSSRNWQRLATVKSAFLIYFALLGLSPILKSLTKSTASDSIWALSCWLLIMNIFSFDYGSGEGAGATKFPASLSTNAAVMASTVLASRLPSTTHVFSLMLFSIEVFGLFPIFRRQLRHISWTGHMCLTLALVMTAGGAVGMTLRGGWAAAILGSFLGSLLTAFVMGGCSWWLISLQKYKNVVTGPWDPARPVLRRHWD
ncbi:hypothetical protein ASPZODRAFT_135018 [Penicilliopsis zonata CBS 506.65]|uniref:GPI2-domain-containing protein n=1 Tax=Penicilliopsis zonata CBS 506.65 TaxID=1073090 RepID=A0A1L9SAS8_9EURO|nr:hypothetical protein ASPZODRAFT_135018 [Penicilliopsis zonata CBS 506.65]OJJ44227.1 hypothetical protein ASPZODRAFT_135018 [Penicilliopsis zonata CBS 506.65]